MLDAWQIVADDGLALTEGAVLIDKVATEVDNDGGQLPETRHL